MHIRKHMYNKRHENVFIKLQREFVCVSTGAIQKRPSQIRVVHFNQIKSKFNHSSTSLKFTFKNYFHKYEDNDLTVALSQKDRLHEIKELLSEICFFKAQHLFSQRFCKLIKGILKKFLILGVSEKDNDCMCSKNVNYRKRDCELLIH